jgi:RNA polymerase sigma factor (sigma-70 family)
MPEPSDESLCILIQTGDSLAEAIILERYTALVHKTARAKRTFAFEYADLLSIGSASIISSARRYDPTKGAKFQTWATMRIGQEINDAVRRARSFYGQRQRVKGDPSRLSSFADMAPAVLERLEEDRSSARAFEQAELATEIGHLRDHLEGAERDVFDLLIEGFDVPDIAVRLELRIYRVYKLHAAIRRKLWPIWVGRNLRGAEPCAVPTELNPSRSGAESMAGFVVSRPCG